MAPPADRDRPHGGPASIDALAERLERVLVEQVERGGVTASAKAAIDRSLDALSGSGNATPERARGEARVATRPD